MFNICFGIKLNTLYCNYCLFINNFANLRLQITNHSTAIFYDEHFFFFFSSPFSCVKNGLVHFVMGANYFFAQISF